MQRAEVTQDICPGLSCQPALGPQAGHPPSLSLSFLVCQMRDELDLGGPSCSNQSPVRCSLSPDLATYVSCTTHRHFSEKCLPITS